MSATGSACWAAAASLLAALALAVSLLLSSLPASVLAWLVAALAPLSVLLAGAGLASSAGALSWRAGALACLAAEAREAAGRSAARVGWLLLVVLPTLALLFARWSISRDSACLKASLSPLAPKLTVLRAALAALAFRVGSWRF
jgi:hypothetical protein